MEKLKTELLKLLDAIFSSISNDKELSDKEKNDLIDKFSEIQYEVENL